MAQALVPLKDLVEAKSRLAGLLRPSERRALAQAMAEDVLAVLALHPGIGRVTLVSDDPCAPLLAAKYAIDYWSEQALGCRGLNAVVGCASERLLARGAGPLLVLHGDLPLLSAEDISVVLDSQRELGGLVIGCDRRGKGTNLLAFEAASAPQFRFGDNSCAAHRAFARDAGVPVRVLERLGIGVDVDEPADMKIIMSMLQRGVGARTRQLLGNSGLAARVELALATLGQDCEPGKDENRGMVS